MREFAKDTLTAKITSPITGSLNVNISDKDENYIFTHEIIIPKSTSPAELKIFLDTPDSPDNKDAYLVNITDSNDNSIAAAVIVFDKDKWVNDGFMNDGQVIHILNSTTDKWYQFDSGLELIPSPAPSGQIQSDFAQTDSGAVDFVKNKFQSDTWANWRTLRNDGELPAGAWVKITDKADVGVIIQCSSNKLFAENSAIGGFLNPDIQRAGNYDGVVDVTSIAAGSRQGVYIAANEGGYAQGDIVIDLNNHYQLTSIGDIDGSAPSSNSDAYTLLPRTAPNVGYIEQWDAIVFNFWSARIEWRFDKRGNRVPYAALDGFQFGDNNITGVVFDTPSVSYFDIRNNTGQITGRVQGWGPYVNLYNNSGQAYFDMQGTNQFLYVPNNSGYLNVHTNGFSSGSQGENNAGSATLYIYDESEVTFDNQVNTGEIYGRYYDGSVVNYTGNAGVREYDICQQGYSGTLALSAGQTVTKNIYGRPLIWKAKMLQIAPIVAQTSGRVPSVNLVPITITTYVAGDDFSNCAVRWIGAPNTTGSIFLTNRTDRPTNWGHGSQIDYNGALFCISTDANGLVGAPLVNTLGGDPTFPYDSPGSYLLVKTGAFPKDKTFVHPINIEASDYSTRANIYRIDDDTIAIEIATLSSDIVTGVISGTDADGLIDVNFGVDITIEVYL